MTMASNLLREKFLEFFRKNNHFIEQSAPLIPQDDPTLLFINAGMAPFKNVFTQKEIRPYKRAASSQKCVRAGGKHNDLENVGQTGRHHTFFEMLGNFSFGDYFKEEAITFAWKFLTEELNLDKSRLSVSVFAGDEQIPKDIEAFNIWHKKIGLQQTSIKLLGRADNFWQMGDSGPCGPCSEIYYDRRDIKIGFGPEDEDEKNIEVWNLVFMQYEMDASGSLHPLPAPCVDTGMGLERLACIVNNLPSNYDTDLLLPLIKKAEQISNKSYHASNSSDDVAMRVIADHARSCAFLIADGLFPSNEGRGYVLRRFMRRAIRHGAHLGLHQPFFHHVCLKVVSMMSDIYGELNDAKTLIERVVLQEEESFRKTLDRGLMLFNQQTKKLSQKHRLPGDIVFRLYETYGFPPDLTEDLAKEHGLTIDWPSFEDAKKLHEKKSSHGLGLKAIDNIYLQLRERYEKTQFIEDKKADRLKVLALLKNMKEVTTLSANESGIAILDKTPFYGESGGQVGDTGTLLNDDFKAMVRDTKKIAGFHLHEIEVNQGAIKVDQNVFAQIDSQRREAIKRNHSATHLLHSALRTVLGTHVIQKGSLVAPDRLRFDFSHFEALTKSQIAKVEDLVNEWILANEEAKVQIMPMEKAKAYGALALFGEKYESLVRVLEMGSHSTELCGGTHCHRTGDIGSFRIISENPLAQGIRRIEATTGENVITHARKTDYLLKDLCNKLSVKTDELPGRINQLLAQLKEAERELKNKSISSLKQHADKVILQARHVGKIQFVSEITTFIDNAKDLRVYADLLRDRLSQGVVALGMAESTDRCVVLVAGTKNLSDEIHAGKIVAEVAPIINGKGGGRPDFAQAGGTDVKNLNSALDQIFEILNRDLKKS
jgi:alanyl-tRNA synthetase